MFGHYTRVPQYFVATTLVPPARPSGPGGRHKDGGENGGLPSLVVVKHALRRHRAGGGVYSLSY